MMNPRLKTSRGVLELTVAELALGSAWWPWPRLIAHRGGGQLAPENTLEAMSLSSRMGWMGCECDAMLSGDGAVVLMHDETLERTLGRPGRVDQTPVSELTRMSAAMGFASYGSHACVPLLAHTLAHCARLGQFCNVEMKPSYGADEATGRGCAQEVLRAWSTLACELQGGTERSTSGLTASGLTASGVTGTVLHAQPTVAQSILLSSFSVQALAAAQARAPQVPRALLLSRGSVDTDDWLHTCRLLGCRAVHAHYSDGTAHFIHRARQAGLGTLFYTVNDPEMGAHLLRLGAGALCCDDLEVMGAAFPALLNRSLSPL